MKSVTARLKDSMKAWRPQRDVTVIVWPQCSRLLLSLRALQTVIASGFESTFSKIKCNTRSSFQNAEINSASTRLCARTATSERSLPL